MKTATTTATVFAGSALLVGALAASASADPQVYVYPDSYQTNRTYQNRVNLGVYPKPFPDRTRYYRNNRYYYPQYDTRTYNNRIYNNRYDPNAGYRYSNGRYYRTYDYDQGPNLRLGPLRIDL